MTCMDQPHEIWNRACAEAGSPKTLTEPGDRALADMLLVHSLAMNGGVLDAVECLTADELAAGLRGYQYFGFEATGTVLEDAATRRNGAPDDEGYLFSLDAEADRRYAIVVGDDAVLVRAFEAQYRREPNAFAATGRQL